MRCLLFYVTGPLDRGLIMSVVLIFKLVGVEHSRTLSAAKLTVCTKYIKSALLIFLKLSFIIII